MRILIFDKYNNPRDLAQMDMYKVLNDTYDVTFSDKSNVVKLVIEGNYDYFYFGIYHPWAGLEKSELELIVKLNTKPIIIDQVDNENFIYRVNTKMDYGENCILLSRYLPNKLLENFWKGKLELFPWYINPDRFIPQEKTNDIAFVCMINVNNRIGADRNKISKEILKYSEDNNLKYKIGEYWGKEYRNILTSSKVKVIDGSRFCLTQKYIESALSKCIIVGEKPISPPNDFITIKIEDLDLGDYNKYKGILKVNRDYALRTFANKDVFISNFEKIISKLN